MQTYIAFLRGINLGGHRVKMDQLRGIFEDMRLCEVTTFIASGNVIFHCKTTDSVSLEQRIQCRLSQSLGYDVDTFIRSREEVSTVSTIRQFAPTEFNDPGNTVHVGFLRNALNPEQIGRLAECRTEIDEFSVVGREYYWLCRGKSHESKVWTPPKMKAVSLPRSTMRNIKTGRRIAALHMDGRRQLRDRHISTK